MIQLHLSNFPVDEIEAELACLPVFEDQRPLKSHLGLLDWRLDGRLSRLILDSKFKGNKGEALLMPVRKKIGVKELLLVGMGERRKITESLIPEILSEIVEKIVLKKSQSFIFSISEIAAELFAWRNALRRFVSMLSGRNEDRVIHLVEGGTYVEDAQARHMDFSYDVEVFYHLLPEQV